MMSSRVVWMAGWLVVFGSLWIRVCVDGWMDTCMHGWMDGWTGGDCCCCCCRCFRYELCVLKNLAESILLTVPADDDEFPTARVRHACTLTCKCFGCFAGSPNTFFVLCICVYSDEISRFAHVPLALVFALACFAAPAAAVGPRQCVEQGLGA